MPAYRKFSYKLAFLYVTTFGGIFLFSGLLIEKSVEKNLSSIHQTILIISFLDFLASTLLLFFLMRYLLKRVRSVIEMAEKIERQELDQIPDLHEDDEFDLLASTIHKLAHSLKLRYSEIETEKKKLSVILENMTEGVMAINHLRKIILINPSACNIFGLREASKASHKTLLELTLNSEIDDMAIECIRSSEAVSREIEISRPQTKILKINGLGLNRPQGGMSAVLVVHDMTQLRNLENLRSEFVANVSHELKTPLTSIHGFIETLLAGAIEDSEKRDSFLKIIQEDAYRLGRLIDDLLEISKLESRETFLKVRPVCLAKQVEQILKILQRQIEAKKIQIENLIRDPNLNLMADEDKLKQVFINLLDNAIKFNKQGGKILIRAEKESSSSQIRVEIEDTGVGISQETIPRIFERFYRVDKARSRQVGGTGLGLSIVKHILEAHRGKIICESQINRGTKFSFWLPST